MDLAPILAAGGIIGLFSAAAVLVVQLFRENGSLRASREGEITSLKSDVNDLKAENRDCEWQVNGLVTILREAGIKIPEYLFRRPERERATDVSTD